MKSSGSKSGGKPAARLGDEISCPPHGTTSILSGSPSVIFEHRPAAVLGEKTACGGTIVEGSSSVLINGKPAAVIGCATSDGGVVISGSATVIIGTAPGVTRASLTGEPLELNPGRQDDYSLAFDFSDMHVAGNHNGIDYSNMPVKITDMKGTYIATVWTDERGVSGSFFTKDRQEVIAWAVVSDQWEVIEEYEVDEDLEAFE